MSTPAATLDWLIHQASGESRIDRKALAGLLAELARNVGPELGSQASGLGATDPRLEQLRTLLVGREIAALKRLCEIVEDPEQFASAVGRVLPAAISHASRSAQLGQVLAPTVEAATQSSIRRDPRNLVNILYPLIVPAIRKSIGETIDETFQSLNESLKHSLSWRGLKWRWEAWRTGRSFAEVVLRHTLLFQLEHAFLIHNHSGLLISHVAAENATSQDPQLVSSMLSAIQDFVRDSFGGTDRRALDSLRFGELTLWSELGPFATLVAVIRGNPPEGLHDILRDALTRIHAEHPLALERFAGDSRGFDDVQAQLSECVALRQIAVAANERARWPLATLGILLLLVIGVWSVAQWRNEVHWRDYVSALRAQPGIVVIEEERRGGKFQIWGLRDPLTPDPSAMLQLTKLDPARVESHWEPYESLAPESVLRRLRLSLKPPSTLTLALSGGRIVARGAAPFTWLLRARAAARLLPAGAPALDLSAVRDFPDGEIGKLRADIQSREIHFDNDQSLPAAEDAATLDTLAGELNELAALSSAMGVTSRVTLTGHSDAIGQGTFNLSLSLARAEAVRALLKRRGVDPDLLAVRAAGPLEPREAETSDAARSVNRRVSFTVEIEE